MVELDLIETLNSGLPKMFRLQKERFFPLPDFEFGRSPDSVSVRIYGKTLDEKYVHALMSTTDMSLEDAILLDRVQKGQPLATEQIKRLRAKNLVSGRGAKIFISAQVADATNTRPEYTRNKGLDDHYYKTLILQHIKQFKSASVLEVRSLLLDKLPDSLTPVQKQAKVKNLLTALRMSGLDGQKIVATQQGKGGRWELLKL
jgi:ATP-dependent DNA helicase RecG